MKQILHDLKKEASRKERAYLVGMGFKGVSEREVGEQLEELALLADTAGAEVVGKVIQMRDAPDSKFYIGSGKADEIKVEIDNLEADTVIFNDDLSPSQIRNLEKVFEKKTIDRSSLILDIFAQHAKTWEAKVAVELAQLNYLSPRLTGMWSHFGQQSMGVSAGGNRIGTRGPGETQLEIDKRIVKKRAAELKEKLDDIERQRAQMKKQRGKLFRVSLVGYTNVGKSTLLNSLTKGGVYAADRLFATLDATTRKLFLAGFGEILLSDTVGFIRKLPHHLVASFRTTLEVVTDSDLICTLMDASSPYMNEQMAVVNEVLNDLKTEKILRLMVFNKMDCIEGTPLAMRLRKEYPDAVFISAAAKTGLDEFKAALVRYGVTHPDFVTPEYLRYGVIEEK